MLKSEVLEIISNGENSGIEFLRDDIRPEQLAKELVALVNFQGGRILLGVEDDGTISGIQRENAEEWVMNVVHDKVHPPILPCYEKVNIDDERYVAVLTLSIGISKPYIVRHSGREDIYIRVGSTSQIATREQQMRLWSGVGI
jgi:ATP-dependent DNA helicase RecG